MTVAADPSPAEVAESLDLAMADLERRRRQRHAFDAHLATCGQCAHEARLCPTGAELVREAVR